MRDGASNISMSVVRRLPRYYRFLFDLMENGVERISSRELSARMGLTASQIRQDFNCFGGFGQQGYGYAVANLYEEIGRILGMDTLTGAVLIGAGNLGRAVANHMAFEQRGMRLLGVFDHAAALKGQQVRGMPVQDTTKLEPFCTAALSQPESRLEAAVLCIPKEAAPAVVERLLAMGIRGFWNFSHYDIMYHHPEAVVENVHLGDSLMTLSYRMKQGE